MNSMSTKNASRRSFLKAAGLGALALSLPDALRAQATDNQQLTKNLMLYIGTYTSGTSEGIYLYQLDMTSGALKPAIVTKNVKNPSFLTTDPNRRFLYAVNELMEFEGKTSGSISAFAINQQTGELILLNRRPTQGGAPCHVSVDKTGKYVFAANYMGGNVTVFPVQSNGSLGAATDMIQHKGPLGPNRQRQEAPHAHNIILDAANKYVFVSDLGMDKVMIYKFDPTRGKLTPNTVPYYQTKPGAGPRHLTFHQNGKYAFLINELNSTITSLAYDATKGSLKEVQTVSTLPKNFTGENGCADIHVSPNGKFVYGSNRGHNSIVVHAIDANTGKLTYVEHVSVQGNWPRNFTIDPSGTFLLVANERTDNIFSFRIDATTGKLTSTGHSAQVSKPVCLKLVTAFA